ncbi:hypothetical protein F443_02296 [Phytophthora nicotianae P1569]|uniref:NADH:flavin oxidoreductase/NADH oxidase N-terminal domain-containing protein n=2 Tax=Phytophthora nicotianae TaxID=4792 RepID=V9FW56_PHYNI|nr:hypothetical protein F443_02296 [Phytophthora nicotianae P1569]ETO83727.1 hypothetical protein F444_02295 [Phytophthora nicotianae P1976]
MNYALPGQIEALEAVELGRIIAREAGPRGIRQEPHSHGFDAKTTFKGVIIANNIYARNTAEGALRTGAADLVGFGRLYITNPDLAERFQNDWSVEPMAGHEVYKNSALGGKFYNDYPSYQFKN